MPHKTEHPIFECIECQKTLTYVGINIELHLKLNDDIDGMLCDYCFKWSRSNTGAFTHISLSCATCDVDCCNNCYRKAKQNKILKKIGNKPHKKSVLKELLNKA